MLQAFQRYRPYLFAIAYRMLGAVSEAEDIVQDTFLKIRGISEAEIQQPKSYLSQVVSRLCIDRIALREKERLAYEGPWLPEAFEMPDTEYNSQSPSRERLSMAFLLMLETLNPPERTVYLLRTAFDHEYEEIALVVDKSPAACRQIFRRAKQKIQATEKTTSQVQTRSLLLRFVELSEAGRYDELQQLFAEDTILIADSGGKVRGAARHRIQGRTDVLRFMQGAATKFRPENTRFELRNLNYGPAIVALAGNKVLLAIAIEHSVNQIHTVYVQANPDKLASLRPHYRQ